MTTSHSHGMKLTNLPSEIRNKIYELVLHNDTSNDSLVCPFILQCSPGKRRYGYSLTQTCRQIRNETLHMWHASSKLLFAMRAENMQYYLSWLRRRPEDIFASIRRIQLEDHQHRREVLPPAHPRFCRSAVVVNLTKESLPVMWKRDRACGFCLETETAVEKVSAVVKSMKWKDGRWELTRDNLERIFEAAAW